MPEDRDMLFRTIARELQRPVQIDSSFDAKVMDVIENMPPHSRPGLWSRLTTPRTITFTPLSWGVLAASLIALASLGALRAFDDINNMAGDKGVKAILTPGAKAKPQRVQFVLVAPEAKKVAVVGDFNGWDASHAEFQAKHNGGGVWSVSAALPAGHHRYSFVVDDSLWMPDPHAPRVVDNDFGMTNSAIVVGEQDR